MQTFIVSKEPFLTWTHWSSRTSGDRDDPASGGTRTFELFWARNGIYHALRLLDVPLESTVLVPSFVCTAAVQPIVAYGAQVEFYNVTKESQLDLEDLEARLSSRVSAVLAIHYFGFPQPIERIRRICDQRRILLIEDCAHVLENMTADRPLGSYGDASIFSWRKFLPVYDGATLHIRRPILPDNPMVFERESLRFTLKVAKTLLERMAPQSSVPGGQWISRIAKTVLRRRKRQSSHSVNDSPSVPETSGDAFEPSLLNVSASRFSRWIRWHSNVVSIVQARRFNFEYLLDRLSCVRGVRPLYKTLPAGICPWVFPVLFDGVVDPHVTFRNRGIPAVTWGGVRPAEVKRGSFVDADYLYDNLVFLPVHQCLRQNDLDAIVGTASAITLK